MKLCLFLHLHNPSIPDLHKGKDLVPDKTRLYYIINSISTLSFSQHKKYSFGFTIRGRLVFLKRSEAHVRKTTLQSSASYPGHPWQVDSPSGQAPFHLHLPDRQGIKQIVCQLKNKFTLAQDKQYLRDTCPKGKLEFQFFCINRVHGTHLLTKNKYSMTLHWCPRPQFQSFNDFMHLNLNISCCIILVFLCTKSLKSKSLLVLLQYGNSPTNLKVFQGPNVLSMDVKTWPMHFPFLIRGDGSNNNFGLWHSLPPRSYL